MTSKNRSLHFERVDGDIGVVTIDAGGEAVWGPGLGVKGAWLAGESRVFQAVYRDTVGSSCQGFDVNFSSAVMIQFTQ